MNLKLLPEEISTKTEVFPIVEKHQETQLSTVAIQIIIYLYFCYIILNFLLNILDYKNIVLK